LSITENVPDWMVSSLDDDDMIIVPADVNGDGHVRLMPTVLRELLDRYRRHDDDQGLTISLRTAWLRILMALRVVRSVSVCSAGWLMNCLPPAGWLLIEVPSVG